MELKTFEIESKSNHSFLWESRWICKFYQTLFDFNEGTEIDTSAALILHVEAT